MPPDRKGALELDSVRHALKGQYVAALSMLREAILRCPDDLWADTDRSDAYDVIACNVAFFARYLLHPGPGEFQPWPGLDPEPHTEVVVGHATNEASRRRPNNRAEALEYVDHVIASLDASLERLDLAAPASGFPWARMSTLEHQIASLRRLQHHTGRLVDRLRSATGEAIAWLDTDLVGRVN